MNTQKMKLKAALFKKLSKARKDFQKKGIQANGENKFNNFDYITLKDIVNNAVNILADNNLCLHHQFYKNPPLIELVDTETGYSTKFGSNQKFEVEGKNTNQKLQGLGSTETYLRRYIYLQILDIVECDPDQNFGKPEPKENKPTPKPTPKPEYREVRKGYFIKDAPTPVEEPVIPDEKIKEVLDKAYEQVTNAGYTFTIENARWVIKTICKGNKALYDACINKLQYKGAKQ